MRLTCPNCGAQYEVPDDVIPTEGRDVQCSNCGTTWFQDHPDHPVEDSQELPEQAEELIEDAPEPTPPPKTVEPDPEPAPAAPERQVLDDSVSSILREEAEREAELRAQESAALETQPDLGLDNFPADEASVRAQQARDRMAGMRGEPAQPAPAEPGSRRSMLPDIEEINSSLRTKNEPPAPEATALAEPQPSAKRSGFTRGFAFALIIVAILIAIYANAPRIAEAVPQLNPALNSYVSLVDQGRNWLDQLIGSAIPR